MVLPTLRGHRQTSGGSIARSMRATSTSIRPIRSMAATCSGLPCLRGVAPPARLAVEGQELVARLGQRRGVARRGLVMGHRILRGGTPLSVPERGRSGLDDREQLAACDLVGRAHADLADRGRRSCAATTCSIFIASSVTTGSPARPPGPAAAWTRQDGAGHRGDDVGRSGRADHAVRDGRPGRGVHVGRWREREGDAPAGEVEVDGVADADRRRATVAAGRDRSRRSPVRRLEADASAAR